MSSRESGSVRKFINEIEETFIALILGLMTAITFANVIARYVFNSNLLWALELTVFLFAWLVLIGMSYCVKTVTHLGVDVIAQMVGSGTRKLMTLIAVACCILYSVLLLKGGWDYWYKFVTTASFLEVDDIPMPDFLQFLADWMNDGERYEKIPRYIPYFVLPLGLALLLYRFLELGWLVLTDRQGLIIASHEAEDLVHEASTKIPDNGNIDDSGVKR
ncbi:MAG: TRAP transporter small permease [Gammaproteobacteria bacterium]|nr:TRAP transporter small permease [Gammaproteobacteria bacterium]